MTDHHFPVRTTTRHLWLAVWGAPLLLCLTLVGCTKDGADTPQVSDARPTPDKTETPARPTDDRPARTESATDAAPDEPSPVPSEPSETSSAPSDAGLPSEMPKSAAPTPPTIELAPSQPAQANGLPPGAQAGAPRPDPPPANLYKPEVILSQHHAQASIVGVGDTFPSLTLTNLEGEPQELSQLYGDRQTIVVFWNATNIYAREQFARIMPELYNRYHGLGINVVAINVGDAPEVVQELAAQYGVTVPCLLDPDGQAFAQVARSLLPRTYLLDAEGRILWFDLEYSRGQRQSLHNAVHYHLKPNGV